MGTTATKPNRLPEPRMRIINGIPMREPYKSKKAWVDLVNKYAEELEKARGSGAT